MIAFIALSVLLVGTNALLFPNNNGAEPEPELLIACPPPAAPQHGSIKCDYGLFDLRCTVQCDTYYAFAKGATQVLYSQCVVQCDTYYALANGATQVPYKCDLFEGKSTADVPTMCVRVGGPVVTNPPVTSAPVGPVVTGLPSTAGNCVSSLNDCLNRPPGDYAYCANCRMFATCASSGFYVRDCPGISVFNAFYDKCTEVTVGACKV